MNRVLNSLCLSIVAVILAASCSVPAPSAEEWAARELAETWVSPSTRARLVEQAEAAHVALMAGRPQDAVDLAVEVLAVDPRFGWVRAVHGRALATLAMRTTPPEIDSMQRAEGELLLARKLAPDHADTQLFHAWFLEADGHMTSAVAVLDELLATHPGHLNGLRAASRLHFELGEERAAEPLLATLVEKDKTDAKSVYRLAHCRLRRAESIRSGDIDESAPPPAGAAREAFLAASETFRSHQALRPADPAGWLGEAHAKFQAALLLSDSKDQADTEIAEVRQILGRAADLDPKSPDPEHSLGVILEHLGESNAARTAYGKALALDPEYLPSILNMAHLLSQNLDHDAAVVFCRRALALRISGTERKRLTDYVAAHSR